MRRYPALQFFVSVIFAIGVLVITLSIIGMVVGAMLVSSQIESNQIIYYFGICSSGLIAFISGMLTIAESQKIQVVIDTEENTRNTEEAIDEMIEALEKRR